MAPLASDKTLAASELEIELEFAEQRFILMMSDLFATDSRRLRKLVGSLLDHQDEIRRAIHRLFNGF